MKKREPIARSVPFFLYRYIMLFMQASVRPWNHSHVNRLALCISDKVLHPVIRRDTWVSIRHSHRFKLNQEALPIICNSAGKELVKDWKFPPITELQSTWHESPAPFDTTEGIY